MDRGVHDAIVQVAKDCKTALVQDTSIMYERLAETAGTVDASLTAWTKKQHRFCELADAVRVVEATVECHAAASLAS